MGSLHSMDQRPRPQWVPGGQPGLGDDVTPVVIQQQQPPPPPAQAGGGSNANIFHHRTASTSSVASVGSTGSGGSSSGGNGGGGGGGGNKKLRRSCDRCTSKKIRCDGLSACENCVRRGYACHYSARKRTGPKIKHAAEEHPEWRGAAQSNGLIPWLQTGPAPGSIGGGGGGGGGSSNSSISGGSTGGGSTGNAQPAVQQAQQPQLQAVAPGVAYVFAQPLPTFAVGLAPPQSQPRPQPQLVQAHPAAVAAAQGGGGMLAAAGPQHMMPAAPASQQPGLAMPFVANPLALVLGQGQGQGQGAPGAGGAAPLVGRTEEEYLQAFIVELNYFLPILDEAQVRQTLKRLKSGAALPPSAILSLTDALPHELAAAVRESQLQNAQNAILWGALAIGAFLVGGSPPEVDKYTTLAWVSMKECFDLATPATISAYLVMGLLWMMHGDLPRYRRYLAIAEGIKRELGCSLSNELEMSLFYLSVGTHPDISLLERQWNEVTKMEPPPDDPQMQMLHKLTRVKTYLLYKRHEGDNNVSRGLPRPQMDVDMASVQFEEALRLLVSGRGASCSMGVIFIKGMIAVLHYVRTRGTKVHETLEMFRPIINHTIRCPGTLRIMPTYHFMHCIGMLLMAAKDFTAYETIEHRLATCSWGDCPMLPPLNAADPAQTLRAMGDLCDHPICSTVTMFAVHGAAAFAGAGAGDAAAVAAGPNLLKREAPTTAEELEAQRREMEGDMTGLSVEDIERLGELFGQGSDFPAYEVF